MAFDNVRAARQADFVQFAYNMFSLGGLMPVPDPGLALAGYKQIFWLVAQDLNERAFYGYIAQSLTDKGDFVLAIRGTENLAEWILDFSALPVPFHASLSVGGVALGFQQIQQSFMFLDTAGVQSSLADVINRIVAQGPVTKFTILGHSLGSALATLTAAELAFRNPSGIKNVIECNTYASPRVGLQNFADWFNKNVPNSMRIWNVLDAVPQVPTPPFIHVEPSFEIVQSQTQLEQLTKTPACEHHLQNYQWLLDPLHYKLSTDCAAVQDQSISTATQAAGAQALMQAKAIPALAAK